MKAKPRGEGVVVLGAGLAGLSAAFHVGPGAWVFEAQDRVGGECATDHVQAYRFDRSGHLLHLRTDEIRHLIERLLPGRWRTITRDARIRVADAEVRYPFQANLYGLAPACKGQALLDYLAARCAKKSKPKNFAQWSRINFGQTMSDLFFEPYNRKLWTVEPADLTPDWMGAYVPKPDVSRVIRGAFLDITAGGGYNAVFRYPRQGGIECLAQALGQRHPRLRLQAPAVAIDARRRTVDITGQGRVAWRHLVSTLPLPACVACLHRPPASVVEASRCLKSNSVLVVNLGVQRASLHPAHWIYFPDPRTSFYRVGFPSNFGQVAPKGCSSLYAEVALPAGREKQPLALARRVRQDLMEAGILRPEDKIAVEHLQYIPFAYVIYNKDYSAARRLILAYLEKQGILSIGRWGHWEYSAMEDALLAGARVAQIMVDPKTPRRKN